MNQASPSIAVVGLACVYPDARTPVELWENVLAQRRAFRRLPEARLRSEDYWSSDDKAPDRTYSTQAAVIEGYEFDRVAFRVAGSTFRAADLAHWLALDVASRALSDAGFGEGRGLPQETTGVILGNTLTGEFSRANALRLRWPYVRRVIEAALAREGWEDENRGAFLERLETDYKAPFPAVEEETLAGGLSNTIAGRICNHFNLKGGGYTVDGACASSLLAIANACSALAAGDLDVALAGGVDLSLDPFELVGFAKTGALASEDMRVFDRRSAGFWPGEGCGFAVLMKQEDALARGLRVYAVIRGWGVSSDGNGGLTRPEAAGQFEAIQRAYRRAGFGAGTIGYLEGHGTGTTVGDATELEVLYRARNSAPPGNGNLALQSAVIGSIKANIGHTKAAAGIAGMIKAVMAVHKQVLPPATGCAQPHQALEGSATLRATREVELWPADQPLRASVSAMGFGGINTHLVIENPTQERRRAISENEAMLSRSPQDAELFLLAAPTQTELLERVTNLSKRAATLSLSELSDLAARLQQTAEFGSVRAAIVCSRPQELAERLQFLATRLGHGADRILDIEQGVFAGLSGHDPRIVFLFPGQGSPAYLCGGIWRRRFESARRLYQLANLPTDGDATCTRLMQPAVVTASLAGLKILDALGIQATSAVGHSLGELTALHWAHVLDEEALIRIARVRGSAMADLDSPTGAMLALAAPPDRAKELLVNDSVSIVGFNSPRQTVVAGEVSALNAIEQRAAAAGIRASRLLVSHAFHTPLVAAAIPMLAQHLAQERLHLMQRPVISTIAGRLLHNGDDLRELLCRQVTSPVLFSRALKLLLEPDLNGADLVIEVGPGSVLAGLVADTATVPVLSLDSGGPSLQGLLKAVGASYVLGATIKTGELFSDRFTRPYDLATEPRFFANPCESAPVTPGRQRAEGRGTISSGSLTGNGHSKPDPHPTPDTRHSTLDIIRTLVAERTELPLTAVHDDSRMLSDLHLNSITVGQLVSDAARRMGLPRVMGITDFANASVAEVAGALEHLKQNGKTARPHDAQRQPPGVDTWVESFAMDWVEAPLPKPLPPVAAERNGDRPANSGAWQVFVPPNHPLAERLQHEMNSVGGQGVLVCLSNNPGDESLQILLDAAHAAQAIKGAGRFLLVQPGWGASGFARTLFLENPNLAVCVINVDRTCEKTVEWILAESANVAGFTEVQYDSQGLRREPRLKRVPADRPKPGADALANGESHFSIGVGDVLLVTGGGKGIGAECALAVACATGASLALMGRSDPAKDRELLGNLTRLTASRVKFHYVRADVCDAAAVGEAVAEFRARLGPVTALLHAAGSNKPRLISALDKPAFLNTIAPKVRGLENVLQKLETGSLRLLITFGSIIARAGLQGEADYATANEWMRVATEEFQRAHPRCKCLALEWSVWSGAGMGQQLGRLETLIQKGIMPIPLKEGTRVLLEWLRQPAPGVSLVIAGRFGDTSTLKMAERELPLRRFLERKRAYYPGIELIVDADLSETTDPYFNDHIVQKQKLLPAVLGLEAMAQAAMAVTGATAPPSFQNVQMTRPVSFRDKPSITIRLAALRRGQDAVEVCLRSEETEFQVDHFRCVCLFNTGGNGSSKTDRISAISGLSGRLALQPQNDLYNRLLFHRGRFCRVEAYHFITAKSCVAELSPAASADWFGPYLPRELALGDPAARDAALHAIQACIPHLRILPVGIEKVHIHSVQSDSQVRRFAHAAQRVRDGASFIYDLEITDEHGRLLERWEGLKLRAVEPLPVTSAWPVTLLAPYIERRLEELAPASPVSVAFEEAETCVGDRASQTDAVIQRALGKSAQIWRGSTGRPISFDGHSVSASHAEGLTLAVAGANAVACDLEAIAARPASVWEDLLGPEGHQLAGQIASEQNEELDAAATRVWTAIETMKKGDCPTQAPLIFEAGTRDGWVLLRSGSLKIASCVIAVQGISRALVAAAAVQNEGSVEEVRVRNPLEAPLSRES